MGHQVGDRTGSGRGTDGGSLSVTGSVEGSVSLTTIGEQADLNQSPPCLWMWSFAAIRPKASITSTTTQSRERGDNIIPLTTDSSMGGVRMPSQWDFPYVGVRRPVTVHQIDVSTTHTQRVILPALKCDGTILHRISYDTSTHVFHTFRMACGYCSLEQPVSNQCVACGRKLACAASNPLGKATRFWEGGGGCRDTRFMTNKDAHKYRGKAKTKSAKSTRVGPKAWSKELKKDQKSEREAKDKSES